MNIIKLAPALLKVWGTCRKYNSNIPKFKKLRETGDVEAEKALIWRESGIWAENTAKALRINFEIEGEENIPEAGPLMVYANHQGMADILAIYYLFRNHFQIGFISKEEWRKLPVLSKAIEYTRSIFLQRENSRAAIKAIGEAGELLAQGFNLAIYPEGTRARSNTPGEFKMAAFKFAEKAGVPILPITIDGSYKVFEIDNNYHPDETVKITVHPLVNIESMNRDERKAAYKDIECCIKSSIR